MSDKPWPQEWCDEGEPLTGMMILERQKQETKFNIIKGHIPNIEEIRLRFMQYAAPNRLYGAYVNSDGDAV